jgi:hypothetical protein
LKQVLRGFGYNRGGSGTKESKRDEEAHFVDIQRLRRNADGREVLGLDEK